MNGFGGIEPWKCGQFGQCRSHFVPLEVMRALLVVAVLDRPHVRVHVVNHLMSGESSVKNGGGRQQREKQGWERGECERERLSERDEEAA